MFVKCKRIKKTQNAPFPLQLEKKGNSSFHHGSYKRLTEKQKS